MLGIFIAIILALIGFVIVIKYGRDEESGFSVIIFFTIALFVETPCFAYLLMRVIN